MTLMSLTVMIWFMIQTKVLVLMLDKMLKTYCVMNSYYLSRMCIDKKRKLENEKIFSM